MSLHRPYLRKETREKIQENAPKNEHGQFIYKGEVIQGKWDYGHVYGHENWHEIQEAEKAGMNQTKFNNHINAHPEYFTIQPHDINISHTEEMSKEDHEILDKLNTEEEIGSHNESEKENQEHSHSI